MRKPATTKTIKGLPFKLQQIPLGDLRVHPKVQREFRPKWAADLAAEFDESALDVLWVNKENGKLYVFDGQHRFEAVKQYLGDGWEVVEVPVRVYDGLDVESLAKLAGWKNNSKAWTAIATFRRQVLANDPIALDIAKMLKGFGLIVHEAAEAGTVRAVKALREVYGWRPNGPGVLQWTLGILTESWPSHANATHQLLIKGVALLYQKHGKELDRAAFVHRLIGHETPDEILAKGRAYSKGTGISAAHGLASVLLRTYNTGRRSGKIQEWAE